MGKYGSLIRMERIMKKRNWVSIIVITFLLIVIGFIVSIIISFFGNPVTKIIATSKIRNYVEATYPNMDLEVSDAVYNFKFGDYAATVQSSSSKDTKFWVSWRKGKINDSYETYVLQHFQTYTRLQMELSDIVEQTIEREFPYETSILFADLDKSMEDFSALTLDMELDPMLIPVPTTLTIYFYHDEISYEVFCQRLQELSQIMEKNNIRIDYYSVVMEKKPQEGEKPGLNRESIYLYDYPADRLNSDPLLEDIKEYIAAWKIENDK
jgi:hypothetical protein